MSLTDLPSEHSSYAEQAMDTLMEPVITGVSRLKVTAQLGTISLAVVATCEAWTDYILQQKIKFRYFNQ